MHRHKPFYHRRKLILTIIAVAFLAALGYLNNHGIGAYVGNTTAIVAISKVSSDFPTNEEIESAVREAVALAGGLPSNIGPGKKIVIQPNMVVAGADPASGVVPRVTIIRTVVNMCKELGARTEDITICEGSADFLARDSSYTDRQMTLQSFRDYGMDANGDMIEDATGVKLVDANNVGQSYPRYPGYSGPYNSNYVTQVVRSNFIINRVYMIPNCVAQADALIRIPCLKNHGNAGMTGALKLAFGFAPSDIYHELGSNKRKEALLHQTAWGYDGNNTVHRGMVDMTLCRPPDFIVMDGLVGITNGPTGYSFPTEGKFCSILASTDPVAIDTIATLAYGYKLSSVPSIGFAADKGLGQNNPARIEVRGKRVAEIRRWIASYGPAQAATDKTPPSFTALSIPNLVRSCGQIYVAPYSYYDAYGVAKVELYLDGVLIGSSETPKYEFAVRTSDFAAGSHMLKCIMYDYQLNETVIERGIRFLAGDPASNLMTVSTSVEVLVGDMVFAGSAPPLGSDTFFVASEHGMPGFKVKMASGSVPQVAIGTKLMLQGIVYVENGQRYLNAATVRVCESASAPTAKYMRNNQLGASTVVGFKGIGNLGLLVRTTGHVSAGDSGSFYISDSTLSVARDGVSALKVLSGSIAQPAAGKTVAVTGFSCTYNDNGKIRRMIVPRTAADISVLD